MGCTVREKHIRTNRRLRSVKPDSDHGNPTEKVSSPFPKSMLQSGPRPLGYPIGCSHVSPNLNITYNPNPNSDSHNPNFDNCGWGYCTEEQLEEILFKNLEFLYNEAVAKLVALGYDDDAALKSVLKNGHCYGGMDVLTNILHNALACLNGGGCCANHRNIDDDPDLVFTDLSQLVEYSLAGMVCLLQQVRPHLNKGDAMWCLLMSDLHVGKASTIEIPMLPARSNVEGVSNGTTGSGMDDASPGLCKFHGGWGFGYAGTSELPVNGFSGMLPYSPQSAQQREIDCPKSFNLSPSMKSLLKRNVAAFAAGFRANTKQIQTQSPNPGVATVADVPSEQGEEAKSLKSQEAVNSILSKFRDLNLEENMEQVPDEHKDEILATLANQIKDLERQLKERKEWAQQKAMQAAKKLSSDLTQLKMLRMEREDTQRLKKGKQTLEENTMKRLSEMENALRKASSQVDRANAAVRQLEVENAEIRAEMEASKLSASESITTCLEVAKREKKYLKRLLNWEKQKAKLQGEIAAEKQKISDLQQQLAQINAAQKDAEVGHILARHGGERITKFMLTHLFLPLLYMYNLAAPDVHKIPVDYLGYLNCTSAAGATLSRKQELEADYIGLLLMASAGYDPRVALTALEKAAQLEGGHDASSRILGHPLSPHPTKKTRIQCLEQALEEAMVYYNQSLSSLDVSSDDPNT